MCGRYTLTSQEGLIDDLTAALGGGLAVAPELVASDAWRPRFNIAPTQLAPVIAMHRDHRAFELMRWGLVPFWAADAGGGKRPPLMINARIETAAQKPAFRDALDHRRCLVPADGFYEWKRDGHASKHAQAMWIHPGARRVIAFAGLWARAQTDAGELHSFAIITGPPNALVAPIHDRMPVILPRDRWRAWLDPALDRDGARALLDVPAIDDWRADPVTDRVNKVDHDDPACLAPAPPPRQGSLF